MILLDVLSVAAFGLWTWLVWRLLSSLRAERARRARRRRDPWLEARNTRAILLFVVWASSAFMLVTAFTIDADDPQTPDMGVRVASRIASLVIGLVVAQRKA